MGREDRVLEDFLGFFVGFFWVVGLLCLFRWRGLEDREEGEKMGYVYFGR